MSVERDNDGKFVAVKCDREGCTATAPEVLPAEHPEGLRGLGWACSGGVHYCPHCLAVDEGQSDLPLAAE